MPHIDLFVMVKIGAGKMCTDLFIEDVRSVIALFGVDNVGLFEAVVTKECFQLVEKSRSKMLTAESGVDRDNK